MQSRARFLGHSIHQLLVAFPVGLLATAVSLDLTAIFGRYPMAVALALPLSFAAGALTLINARLGGELASRMGVDVSDRAHPDAPPTASVRR
jgi:uncharacterized membrane protein